MALINQKAGAAQGNPNAELYKLAAKQSYSSCSAETIAANPTTANNCYFYDIDNGNIAMPCAAGDANCTVSHSGDTVGILSGYNATAGYDMATGLGSLNVANVVNAWPSSIGTAAATVTVAPATSSITTDQSLNLKVTVASSPSGGATPTRMVTLLGGGLTPQTEILSGGSYTFTIAAGELSIGSDTLTVTYSGDSTYASETAQATVAVAGLVPTVAVTPPTASINSNTILAVTVAVTGSSSHETNPTGSVTLAGGGYSSTQTLSGGSYKFAIPYNTFTSTENVTLTATYNGDSIYDAGYTATANVAVTYVPVLTPTVTVTPTPTTLDSNQSLNVQVVVSGSSTQETYPTGTVTLSSGSYSSTAQLSSGAYTFTIPANTLLSGGITSITATYNNDADYRKNTGTATVTVTPSVFSVAVPAISGLTAGASSGNTSTITLTALGGYSGIVALGCSLTRSPTGANSNYLPSCTLNTISVTLNPSVNSGTETAIATITTSAAPKSELNAPQLPGSRRGIFGAGGGALLAFMVLLGIPARRRGWRSMLGVLLLLAALGSLTACNSGGTSTSTSTSGTTAGTYIFTVTATGNDAEKTVESASLQVTVTK
jgi:hypothetical protein